MNQPDYWAEIEAAWADRAERPAPRRIGPVRGGMLAAVMLGLHDALEPPKHDEVVIEIDIDEAVHRDQRVRLLFDPASPTCTVAAVRSA